MSSNWVQRVGWLIVIWLSSVLALAAVAAVFRVLMGWAGLKR